MKTSRILFCLFAASMLAACAFDDDSGIITTTANIDTETETVTTEELYEKDSLPEELNLNGDTVNIGYYSSYQKQVAPDSESGELLDDEIFKRNSRVMERLNVTIEAVPINVGWVEYLPYVQTAILAGTGDFDAFYLWAYDFAPQIIDNYFLDLSDAPYLDLSKPWWAKDYMNEMSVDGKSFYFLMGDIGYGMMNNASCMYFNKQLYANYYDSADSMYELVMDGGWTLDKFGELGKSFYVDTNGDGEKNLGDTLGYGIITTNGKTAEHIIFNAGNRFTYRGDDGYPVLDVLNDRMVNTIDKMIDLFHNNEGALFIPAESGDVNDTSGSESYIIKNFTEDKAAFLFGTFGDMSRLRDMESDYGVIPFPKYDEAQESYLSLVHNVAMMYGIPSDCQHVDTICAVMEALASDSHRTVMPIYYELVLKEKYARDNISSQIIDLIHDNMIADFGYTMELGIYGDIRYMGYEGENRIASHVERNTKSWQKKLEDYIEAVENAEF